MRVTGGRLRGRTLKAPRRGTRPMADRVRQALFNVLAARRSLTGARILDLYAGSGSLGIEALSRGAAWADFVERHRAAAAVLRENLRRLGLEAQGRIWILPVERFLSRAQDELYDIIFCDPPYADPGIPRLLERLARWEGRAPGGWVVLGHSRQAGEGLAEAYPPLNLLERRCYGGSCFSIYGEEEP